ncbi:MAG TPA: type IV toxin-antitoxin system AbiEi family antitoxin [Tepidisphaeraceae bacterium]|nr:type IV toxin-antitoxin system AbiEi family antitoxin [Tepidisphaeraceae bacterium]
MKPLLLTEHVNDSLAERLQKVGIDYLDAAGNAYLVADPHVYIWLQGFKPPKQSQRVSRAFQTTGLQLIALLLSRPNEVERTYREIAERAGLSLGSVSRIVGDLRSLGFIRLIASGKSSLVNRRDLLEHWELGYATRLRPRLEPQAFRQAEKLPVEDLPKRIPKAMRDEILVGGELAAALATRNLRPQTATFHVRPHRPLSPLIKEMRLIPDRDGNIVLLEQFGEMPAWGWEGQENKHLANPLLVYAELLQRMPDDRLRETANLILNEYLAPILDESAITRG